MRSSQTLGASSMLLASLATTAQAVTCYSGVNVFTARGTDEVPSDGLGLSGVHVQAILSAVPNSNYTVIDYPATFSNSSVPTGIQNANKQISEYMDACPDSKIVITGYSQGADVMGLVLTGASLTIAADGSARNYTVAPLPSKYGDQVAAVVFFGDPQYNINTGVNSDAPYPCKASSYSPRDASLFAPYADRLEEWCSSDDLICCSTSTSFAGHTSYFSAENGTITGEFVAGKLGLLSGSLGSLTTSAPAITSMSTPSKPSGWMSLYTIPHPVSAESVSVSVSNSTSRISKASSVSRHSTISRYSSASAYSSGSRIPLATSTSTPTSTPPPKAVSSSGSSGPSNPLSMLVALFVGARFLI